MIGIYFRVSTTKQETRSQRKAIEDWCRKCSYPNSKLIEYVDEGVTGKTLDRPAFKRLMKDVDNGKVTKIVTFELSRLSRNFLDLLVIMRTLTLKQVTVEVPGEGAIQFENAMEQFVVAAKSLNADQERERISIRTKAGLAAAKARGVKLGARKGAKHRKGKFKQHDPAIIERVLRLGQKLTFAEISQETGLSASTAWRILQKYGTK